VERNRDIQEKAEAVTLTEPMISPRAKAIAEGLIRTDRAGKHGVYDQGMLRLERRGGGFYWIALNGSRLLRGDRLTGAASIRRETSMTPAKKSSG
jgi:hypothetical protein